MFNPYFIDPNAVGKLPSWSAPFDRLRASL